MTGLIMNLINPEEEIYLLRNPQLAPGAGCGLPQKPRLASCEPAHF